ncbi:hypothetical protein PR001_g6377 [Phytophthora rubi]|uniref:Uncharacterized protein n=1 Tax=Phytophthora rubi TaxID=129364 RepID=A0A6A3N923_9STRA|nr:hypothetical protein PR001_g6377 [Phytophthora rubi]
MHAEEEDDGADVEQEEKEEKSEEVCGEDDGVAAAESKGECGGSSPRQGQKRSVEEVDEDMLVSVPPVQQQHNDENMAFTWTNTCTTCRGLPFCFAPTGGAEEASTAAASGMATQEAQEVPPGGQGRRTSLRPRKEVDYVQAAMGRLTKEHMSDGDYVQDEIDGEEDDDDGEEVEDSDDGEEVEGSDDGEEVEGSDDGEEVEGSGNGEEVEDSDDGEDLNAGEDGEGMDAGGDDVEEGDNGEDGEDVVEEGGDDEEGEDLVEEGDADAENADVTADDDADENMVGRTTTTPSLSRPRQHRNDRNNGKYCKFCKRNNHSDAECFRNPESLAYRPWRPNNRGSGTNSSHNNGGNDRAFAAMQEQVAEMAAMWQELKRRQEEELNSLRFYRQDELSVMIDDELVDEQPPVDERAETLAAL